jgi:hypothetical protein
MPNIVIPNTSEGRAILAMISQQTPETQTGFKRKYPFSEMAVPAVPVKKTRYN